MQKALLVAEKSSVAKDIQKVYDKIKGDLPYELVITSAAGHVVGLCEPDEYAGKDWGTPWKKEVLPMVPDIWQTKVINPKVYKSIKDRWEEYPYDFIINAGDAGREGQLIQSYIYEKLGINVPIMRFWANDTTEKTIEKTLKNLLPNEKFKNLEAASRLRAEFDWLIGMNLSRAGTLSLGRNISVGRVMTVVLYMIVKREKEIESFKPEKYYTIEAEFAKGENKYTGTFLSDEKPDISEFAIMKKAHAMKTKSELAKSFTVKKVTEKEVVTNPPTLFNLTDLQKLCASSLGFSPAETLSIAQGLYEKHYLSYPRTESRHLSTAQTGEIKKLVRLLTITDELKNAVDTITDKTLDTVLKSKRYINDGKVQDHPALTPTFDIPDLNTLTEKERKVYLAVVKRLVSIFLPPKKTVTTTIITENKTGRFKTTGSRIISSGYTILYGESETESPLPPLKEGEKVTLTASDVAERQTKPPARYTDASILTAMETAGRQIDEKNLEKILNECNGIGTPATRADILKKLEDDNYIEKRKKAIYPTGEGMELITLIDINENSLLSPKFTAVWEEKLKEVEDGKESVENFIKVMNSYIINATNEFLSLKHVGAYKKEIGKCPKCGKNFYELQNYCACEDYLAESKSCDFTLSKKIGGAKLTTSDVVNLITGNTTSKKTFKKKDGTTFTSMLILDGERKLHFVKGEKKTVGTCPKCSGRILMGDSSYFCENFAKEEKTCDFYLPKKCNNHTVTNKEVKEILESGKTSNPVTLIFKSGKHYSGNLCIDEYAPSRYGYKFAEETSEEVCNCPYCDGGKINKKGIFYYCSNLDNGCNFKIFSTFCETEITPKDIKVMLLDKRPVNKMLTFKDKKTGEKYAEEKGVYIEYGDYKKTGRESNSYGYTYRICPICKCPFCSDGYITNKRNWYFCTGTLDEKCDFGISSACHETVLTKNDVKNIIYGKTISKMITYKKKNGETFDKLSSVKLRIRENSKFKYDFETEWL